MIQPLGLAVLDMCGAGAVARAAGHRTTRMYGAAVTLGRRVLDVSYSRDGQAEAQGPATHSHGTLPRPYAPALAFVGDAAHRAIPQLGQRANMALFDALALARALKNAPLDEALPR